MFPASRYDPNSEKHQHIIVNPILFILKFALLTLYVKQSMATSMQATDRRSEFSYIYL